MMIRTAMISMAAFVSMMALPMMLDTAVAQVAARAYEIDEYKTPDLSAHADNLDNWVIELQNDPTSQGYVIAYGGRPSRPGDALKAANNQIAYAVDVRGIDQGRLSAVNGGYRAVPTIELWILHNGAAPPAPRPTIRRKH